MLSFFLFFLAGEASSELNVPTSSRAFLSYNWMLQIALLPQRSEPVIPGRFIIHLYKYQVLKLLFL